MANITKEQSTKVFLLEAKNGETLGDIAAALLFRQDEILAEDVEIRLDCHGE